MNPERWKEIKSILEQAIEVAPPERALYLDEVCGNDRELRREVEALLDFDNTRANALEQPAFSILDENGFGKNAKNLIGKQIGNYKVVDELGIGGMGAVFLAERADGAFNQKVALKIVKRGMDTDAVLRRFLNERQILAALEHPNIAHLIDGGTTEDGLPYFVMEYVEGEAITNYAALKNLNLEERLKLFREVCAAVSFAHTNLVIHRDLKPSNILVTKDGTPKLLDFGIAKLLKSENTIGETATRSFIFTPEYASPEQMRGEKLTTATDVYSLGVILYELLTGTRPYKTSSRNISDIIRAVCETLPERPSSVVSNQPTAIGNKTNPNSEQQTTNNEQQTKPKSKIQNPKLLKGDLDNIILKALRKEPERRYSSVEQFSEDIRRHLDGLPVTASKDTWNYRASKFIQRNRYGVVAAGLVLITLLVGLGATLYQADVARRERAKAERRFADVRQLTTSFLFEFHDAIESLSGSTPARKLVVSRAIEYLDKLAAESAGDVALQRELATAYSKIGLVQGNSYHSNLGDNEGAMKSYRRSLEIRQRLVDADPGNRELQHELADSHEGVGDMLYTINDLNGALESYEKAVAILEKIVADEPNNLEFRYSLAGVLGKRGDVSGMEGFPNLGDAPRALDSYRRGVAIYEKLIETQPENEKYKSGYAIMLYYYGMMQTTTGDAKNAITNGQKSISILESLIAANPGNAKYETYLMSALVFMRYPLLDEGRTTEAIQNARRVVQTMEKLVAADPKSAYLKRSLSVSYNSLGRCLLQAGDAKGAIENHRRSLAMVEELSAAGLSSEQTSRDISITKQYLAEAQLETGEYDQALLNLRISIVDLEKEVEAGNADFQTRDDLALCLVSIGRILTAKGDLNGAVDNFRRALPLAEEVMQKNPYHVKYKSRHAASFYEAGKAFAKLAQTESGEKRQENRLAACNYFKRSSEIWNQLRQTGTLSAVNANRPDEVSRELSICQ